MLFRSAFAVRNNLALSSTSRRKVKVAGGGELISDSVVALCNFKIQGKGFTTHFRILQLQGTDIILGVNWMRRYNPVEFDFIGRQITIHHNNTPYTFGDHMVPNQDFLISAADCHKLMDEGAQGFLVNLTVLDNEPTVSQLPTVPPDLEPLLDRKSTRLNSSHPV